MIEYIQSNHKKKKHRIKCVCFLNLLSFLNTVLDIKLFQIMQELKLCFEN